MGLHPEINRIFHSADDESLIDHYVNGIQYSGWTDFDLTVRIKNMKTENFTQFTAAGGTGYILESQFKRYNQTIRRLVEIAEKNNWILPEDVMNISQEYARRIEDFRRELYKAYLVNYNAVRNIHGSKNQFPILYKMLNEYNPRITSEQTRARERFMDM